MTDVLSSRETAQWLPESLQTVEEVEFKPTESVEPPQPEPSESSHSIDDSVRNIKQIEVPMEEKRVLLFFDVNVRKGF